MEGGTHGSRLHGKPMYSGRPMTIFTLSVAAVTVGGVLYHLNEYKLLLRTRSTPRPLFRPRVEDQEHTRCGSGARRASKGAEMILKQAAAQPMERRPGERRGWRGLHVRRDMALAATMREASLQS